MNISLELVPRDKALFLEEIDWAKEHIPVLTHLNIPDLVRLPIRSWEAARWKAGVYPTIIHVRACDFSPSTITAFYNMLKENNLSHLLIVQGDTEVHGNEGFSTLEMIRELKSLDASLHLYAALDPYRHSLRDEMHYLEEKRKAGAEALLTQPFFEKALLQEYIKACQGLSVWWGISPILSEKSLLYWREKNHVPLPDTYDLSLEANVHWAQQMFEMVSQQKEYAIYIMPIKVDIKTYLPLIFE